MHLKPDYRESEQILSQSLKQYQNSEYERRQRFFHSIAKDHVQREIESLKRSTG